MTHKEAVEFISHESERQVTERLGGEPDAWLTGGTQHNDYRLQASVEITVSDSGTSETYDGELTEDALREFIKDWLDATMEK